MANDLFYRGFSICYLVNAMRFVEVCVLWSGICNGSGFSVNEYGNHIKLISNS